MTVTYTAYDGDAAWADLTSSLTVQTRYLAGPGVNQWFAQITSSGDEWLLTDRLGSVRDVVNSAGTLVLDHTEYQPFGGVASDTNAAAASAYGLDGERFNRTTGMLQSDGTRDVDTQTDQWDVDDPSGFAGGDPNLRRDVGNDPTNAIDPTGLADEVTLDPTKQIAPSDQMPDVGKPGTSGDWQVIGKDKDGVQFIWYITATQYKGILRKPDGSQVPFGTCEFGDGHNFNFSVPDNDTGKFKYLAWFNVRPRGLDKFHSREIIDKWKGLNKVYPNDPEKILDRFRKFFEKQGTGSVDPDNIHASRNGYYAALLFIWDNTKDPPELHVLGLKKTDDGGEWVDDPYYDPSGGVKKDK